MESVKELPSGKIATRVATCFMAKGRVELRVYEQNLIKRNGILS